MTSVSSQTPLLLSQTGLQLHHSRETPTQLLSLSFTPFTLALQTDSSPSFSDSLPSFPPQTLNPFWHLFFGGLGLTQSSKTPFEVPTPNLIQKERRWGAKRVKAGRYFNTNSLIKCKILGIQSFFFFSKFVLGKTSLNFFLTLGDVIFTGIIRRYSF